MRLGNLLLGLVLVAAAFGAPSRVLFVGDSFTFVQDLPHRFAAVAQSKGHQVEIANSTIGGCTLYYIYNTTETQDLLKQQWDYIVLQDFSQLPTVPEARRRMQDVAIRAFAAKKGNAKLVSYNTWGYFEGINKPCPDSDNAQCFPLGTLAQLSPNCQNDPNVWQNKVRTYDCMTYAVARGYIDTFSQGIHLVVPCGESWQVARDSTSIPADCKALIDKEYSAPLANNLTLPLQVPNKGDTAHIMLYNDNGKDKHPSPAGQYLNSLVFYATLFNDSPVGATYMEIPAADAAALQRVAAGVVLNHKQAWGLN